MIHDDGFALDVDGILCNFIEGVTRRIFQRAGHSYQHDEVVTWDVFESFPKHQHLEKEIFDELRGPGGCSTLLPYPDARAGVDELRKYVPVFFVTAPIGESDTWMGERAKWLRHLFDAHDDDIYHARKKHRIHARMFMDDKGAHIRDWHAWHPDGHAFLWNQKYNQDDTAGVRVYGWSDVITRVREIVQR
jgi:5'(3')-deoxyribonucleotidase